MSYVVLTHRERDRLVDLFFRLWQRGDDFPQARTEAMTALRCLKAIHSNAIEDKRVDRIFLQVLLHDAGLDNRQGISPHYDRAAKELQGQEKMLRGLEARAREKEPFSISLLLEMHRAIFEASLPGLAGRFRMGDVDIEGAAHRPPHHSRIQELLFQRFAEINDRLFALDAGTREGFLDVLRLSADVHYLVAHVHPFEDGNGRVARAAGDYAMLAHGLYYDVIMTDYRDTYLDALDACSLTDSAPLYHFIEFSYLETLQRIAGFFELVSQARRDTGA